MTKFLNGLEFVEYFMHFEHMSIKRQAGNNADRIYF